MLGKWIRSLRPVSAIDDVLLILDCWLTWVCYSLDMCDAIFESTEQEGPIRLESNLVEVDDLGQDRMPNSHSSFFSDIRDLLKNFLYIIEDLRLDILVSC